MCELQVVAPGQEPSSIYGGEHLLRMVLQVPSWVQECHLEKRVTLRAVSLLTFLVKYRNELFLPTERCLDPDPSGP